MNDSLYLVMPAYNEAENIENTIKQWYPIVHEIGCNSKLVIVDDGSKDSTLTILDGIKDQYPLLVILSKSNSGHGASCIYAYNYAITKKADYIFQTDSDGQTSPNEFWLFWEKRKEYEFIVGSRKKREDGKDRIFVTKILKGILFIIFNVIVEDCNTPFRLMRSNKLNEILKFIPEDFFLSNVIISTISVKFKYKTLWIPITFKERQGGVNSINFKKITKIGIIAIRDFFIIKKNLNIKNNSIN